MSSIDRLSAVDGFFAHLWHTHPPKRFIEKIKSAHPFHRDDFPLFDEVVEGTCGEMRIEEFVESFPANLADSTCFRLLEAVFGHQSFSKFCRDLHNSLIFKEVGREGFEPSKA